MANSDQSGDQGEAGALPGESSGISAGAAATPAATAKGTSERAELGKRAQAVARRVSESKATVPHIYLQRTVEPAGPGAAETAALIAATGRALAAHPGLNCSYRDGAIETYSRVNVGLLVETADGPLVPTLFDADKEQVQTLATRIEELSAGARAGSLASPAYSGATFTLSRIESGADLFLAPVTPGQAAHLSIGRARQAIVAGADGGARAAEVLTLGLSCDARAVRPPVAADFLQNLAALIGNSTG